MGTPFIRNYDHKEYKEHEQNWAVTQDHRGIMYFGNTHGILEYDGVQWRFIATTTPDIVRSLAVDKNGVVYVGGHNYFGYLQADSIGQMKFISLSKNLSDDEKGFKDVWKTYATTQGVYFQTRTALYLWADNKLKVWKPENIFHLSYNVRDTLYIRQFDKGLMFMDRDSLRLVKNGEFYADKRIYAMIPMGKKKILIGTRNHGLYVYDGHSSNPFYTEADKFLKENKLYGGVAVSGNQFVLATLLGGIVIIDRQGKQVQILNREMGINDNKVWNLFPDKQGGLWLALDKGISRIQFPAPLTFFGEQSGLKGTAEFITRYDNRIYVSSHQGLYAQNRTSRKNTKARFENIFDITSQIWGLLSLENSILFSVDGVGIYEITGKQKKIISPYVAYSLTRSKIDPGVIFLGLPDGIAFLQRQGADWIDRGRIPIEQGPIRYIVETKHGDLWLGTSTMDICKLTYASTTNRNDSFLNPRIEYFNHKNGLPESVQYYVFSFKDEVFFGTSNGLYRYSDSSQRFIPDSSIGADFSGETRTVQRLEEDSKGNAWMATVTETRFELGIAIPEKNAGYTWNYIPFLPLHNSVIYAIYPDPAEEGIVWFGGSDGIFRYDMNIAKNYSTKYAAIIRKLYTDEDSLLFAGYSSHRGNITSELDLLQIDYQHNALRVEFAAPIYDHEQANQYQYFLDGFDKKWLGWTQETKAIYTNIPEGKYLFRVRAKNIYDQISEEGLYGFEIIPPWYRTWMAYTVYGIFILGSIMGMIQMRSRKLEREKQELEELVRQRTEEIQVKNILLTEQSEKVREMNNLKSNFYANISHEFRTPLTLIISPTEEILANKFKGDSQKAHRSILRNSKRMQRLINQMLDLSKLENGSMELRAAKQSLSPFLNFIVDIFSSLAETRHIHLQYLETENDYQLYFEKDKLENIMYNLLSNAFKFTAANGHISVALNNHKANPDKYPDGAVEISIHDTGAGISKEQLPYIFDRFSQGAASNIDGAGGSGIGLALTKELVELHRGEINVSSEPGLGTEFSIILPQGLTHLQPLEIIEEDINKDKTSLVAEMDLVDVYTEIEQQPKKAEKAITNELPLILVVEDNQELRKHISSHLRTDYEIIEANNGLDGLNKARELLPDLIISDIMMPEMDGNELCDRIKKDSLTNYIPIILLTARASEESKIRGLQTGADDYLTKPFNIGELAIRIKNMITSRQIIRDKFKKEFLLEPSEILVDSIDDAFVKQVHDIIEKEMNNPDFTTDVLQKKLAMSRRQFFRKIEALTGQTPGQFIRVMRLKRARQLIEQKAGTISQIAFEVGFNNLSYFSKCFRTQFGKLPSEI